MNKYIIKYSKDAKQDLINIKRYIKYNLQESNIANRLISKIKFQIDKLENNPEKYPVIDDEFIKSLKIRKLIVANYIVFYKIKNNNIQIIRVLYGRRNWIKML